MSASACVSFGGGGRCPCLTDFFDVVFEMPHLWAKNGGLRSVIQFNDLRKKEETHTAPHLKDRKKETQSARAPPPTRVTESQQLPGGREAPPKKRKGENSTSKRKREESTTTPNREDWKHHLSSSLRCGGPFSSLLWLVMFSPSPLESWCFPLSLFGVVHDVLLDQTRSLN